MGSYLIRRGDTLSALAARFHTSVAALARLNGIKNVNLIYAGAKLQVPGSSDTFEPSRPVGPQSPGHAGGGSQALANAGRQVAAEMNRTGLCATGVSRAIARALGISVHGNGNQIDDNLPRSRFRQVNMSLEQALKVPGLVLTWERTSSSLGSIYGHTAITAGDGHTSYSDHAERYTTNSGRSGLKIFMPI